MFPGSTSYDFQKDFTDDLIQVHKDCYKLMPLVHLPIQSGSNKVLELMNRKHNIREYLEIIEKLKNIKPEIKFSSDFIIGYPGETINDFKQTLELMKKVKFINSYSFIFSARPGTPAFNKDKINQEEAKDRLTKFQNLADEVKIQYRKNLINKLSTVLFENKVKNQNKYFGRDEFYNSVIVESNENLIGKIKNIKILDGNKNTLFGEVKSKIEKKICAA